MSEDSQQPRSRQRSGWWIAMVLLLIPLLYVLSPPIVMQFCGGEVFFKCDWVYRPVQHLERSSPLFSSCYQRYFSLFPTDYWFAWYVSSHLEAQTIEDLPIPPTL